MGRGTKKPCLIGNSVENSAKFYLKRKKLFEKLFTIGFFYAIILFGGQGAFSLRFANKGDRVCALLLLK